MFTSSASKLSRYVAELKTAILWQEDLRQTLNAATPALAILGLDQAALDVLRVGAPSKLSWQILDSSAAVTRMYALLEQAICELIEEYILYIANLHPKYQDLGEVIRTNHRVGVGYILSKWSPNNTLFSSLPEDAIAAGLIDGLRGNSYRLLSDAFLTDSDNYRPEVINRIFAKLGVKNAFDRAVRIPDAQPICANIVASGDTPTSYLNRIIRERNEASHGNFATVSAPSQLAEYADFVDMLVFCLATLLRTQIIDYAQATGATQEVAVAVKKYSGSVYGSRASTSLKLEPGQTFFGGKGLIHEVTIEELRVGKSPMASIDVSVGTEFGMRLSRELPESSPLLMLKDLSL